MPSVRVGIAQPPSFLAHRQQPPHGVLDLRAALVPSPQEQLGDGSGVVRRVLEGVDPPVVSGLGLKGRQECRRTGYRWVPVIKAELTYQHAELAVGLQLVIGRPGPDFRVSARVLPPPMLLPGDGSAHLGKLTQAGPGLVFTEQVTAGQVRQSGVIGRKEGCDGIVAQVFHSASMIAGTARSKDLAAGTARHTAAHDRQCLAQPAPGPDSDQPVHRFVSPGAHLQTPFDTIATRSARSGRRSATRCSSTRTTRRLACLPAAGLPGHRPHPAGAARPVPPGETSPSAGHHHTVVRHRWSSRRPSARPSQNNTPQTRSTTLGGIGHTAISVKGDSGLWPTGFPARWLESGADGQQSLAAGPAGD